MPSPEYWSTRTISLLIIGYRDGVNRNQLSKQLEELDIVYSRSDVLTVVRLLEISGIIRVAEDECELTEAGSKEFRQIRSLLESQSLCGIANA